MPSPHQPARKPAAQKTSPARRRIGNPAEGAHVLNVKTSCVIKILRQPKKVEVPGGIAEKFSSYQTDDLARTQQSHPRNRSWCPSSRLLCSAFQPSTPQPPAPPQQAQSTREKKHPSPGRERQ